MLYFQQQHMCILWKQGLHTVEWPASQRREAEAFLERCKRDPVPCAHLQHTVSACLCLCVHVILQCFGTSITYSRLASESKTSGGSVVRRLWRRVRYLCAQAAMLSAHESVAVYMHTPCSHHDVAFPFACMQMSSTHTQKSTTHPTADTRANRTDAVLPAAAHVYVLRTGITYVRLASESKTSDGSVVRELLWRFSSLCAHAARSAHVSVSV